jgi:dethiobiotin synthetase
MRPIFVTGIGTAVGKTLVAAIIAEALQADYWKPVQAGFANGTDSDWVKNLLSNPQSIVHPELYRLKLAASPHIAAREEGVEIRIEAIADRFGKIMNNKGSNPEQWLIIEGAGGLLVPLNEKELIVDLIEKLNVPVIIVSRNYLGSINHSLLTAEVCRSRRLNILGWVFNDRYLDYETEIMNWTGIQALASLPFIEHPDKAFVSLHAEMIKPLLKKII